jgi:2-polyprenyl-3-methyl-5-hydroxy-6-metoxy-1,4-benzoquinol methylase
MTDLKKHWEAVYSDPAKVKHTWSQAVPDRTLLLLDRIKADKTQPIIDVGGGDSILVDYLLLEGYTDITVLDISEQAIECSKNRLGEKASKINWVVSNILDYESECNFAVWIDRAAFHFLQSPSDIQHYYQLVDRSTKEGSSLIISTFSEVGPAQCSGLPVKRYDKYSLTDVFKGSFDRQDVIREDHITPANTLQQFIYVHFNKRSINAQPNHSLKEDELFLSDLTNTIDEEASGDYCGIDQAGCCC